MNENSTPASSSLRRMFGLTPCPHCEGSGCNPCDFTGFPAGQVPPSVKARLVADGLDPDEMAADLRRHPANQGDDW